MGLIRFVVPAAHPIAEWPEAHEAYLSGADGRIFPTRVELEGQLLVCRRMTSESSRLHVAYPVMGFGRPMISTATLPEREQPYLLAVELARGKLVQLRNQVATWELAGLRIPPEFHQPMRMAHRLFGKAASSQNEAERSSELASGALAAAFEAARVLTWAYAQQSLLGRQQRYAQIPSSIGCEFGAALPTPGSEELFASIFSSATVGISWKQIEASEGDYRWDVVDQQLAWCESQKLLVRAGPLIDLGPGGLPDWLAQWEHDYYNLQSFLCDFIETAIARYQGRIRFWEIAARLNTGGALSLNEEARLTLVARSLEVARKVDEESQLLVRIEQPWGEYLARGQHRLSPLQLVDALVRTGVGLAAVNLELAMGYRPRGSAHRDLLELSRLIDAWSVLGIPLYVTLAIPAGSGPDALAQQRMLGVEGLWTSPPDEQQQARWIQQFLPLLMAKPAVAGVLYTHLTDAQPHAFPHAGLMRADGTPRPALDELLAYRQQHSRRPPTG